MSIVFDQAAGYYDQTRRLPAPIERWMAEAVQTRIGVMPGARMLEIGAGTGRIALPLARRGYRYTSGNLSSHMMRTGRGKASDVQIALVQSDVARLPLRNDTFDAVIAVHIFHLVSAWQQAMNEVARVVRHGGMLLHGTTKRDDDREHPLRKLMQDWANELQHQNDGRLSWNEINEQLAQCFGSPQEYMSPAWTTTHTPQCIID